MSGNDLGELRKLAQSNDFRPVELGTRFSIELTGQVRKQDSANVVGILPGSDPKLRDQAVIFMAHHDHLGISAERNIDGDNIYNGAVDNASGTAGLLTIAKAFSALPVKPRRSILFAAVAAEEQGLLGSQQFAQAPPMHPGLLAAVVNIDGANILGETHDVNVIGNKIEPGWDLTEIAKSQNGGADLFPDRGYYYRSINSALRKSVCGCISTAELMLWVNQAGKRAAGEVGRRDIPSTHDEYQISWGLRSNSGLTTPRLVGLEWDDECQVERGDEFEAARLEAIRTLKASRAP